MAHQTIYTRPNTCKLTLRHCRVALSPAAPRRSALAYRYQHGLQKQPVSCAQPFMPALESSYKYGKFSTDCFTGLAGS